MPTKGNGVSRIELYTEMKELRKESQMQYTAIAEFMGRSDACVSANARRLDEHETDLNALSDKIDALNTREKIWSGVNSVVGAVAVALWGTNR